VKLNWIATAMSILAALLALVRVFTPEHRSAALEDLAIDICGVLAAILPVVIGRFRELARQAETTS
jgi:hypothetical protein